MMQCDRAHLQWDDKSILPSEKKLPKNTKPPRPPSPPPPIAMPRGKELSPYTCTKICEARACGLTPKEIAFQHSVNVDTIRYTLKKERARLENAVTSTKLRTTKNRRINPRLPCRYCLSRISSNTMAKPYSNCSKRNRGRRT